MSLVIRELRIKATEIPSHPSQNDYHQATSQKVVTRIQQKKKPYSFLVGGQTSTAIMENKHGHFSKYLNKEVLYDPV